MKLAVPADIAGLARLILSPDCQSIAFLTGAGFSTASGIPDFRSAGGMYATLRPELITASERERNQMKRDPTTVVSWSMFQSNPLPYLEVRRPFILGTRNRTWKATLSHRFAELLHIKTNKLTRIYTQNIDGLDRQCDAIPPSKIVNVHGSISEASCEGCGHKPDFDQFCESVQANIKDIYQSDPNAPQSSCPILCEKCHQPLVKPTTVLFGRNLPSEFFERSEEDLPSLDLLIIAGTSLVVSPANSLVHRVPDDTIRVVVNRDPVGENLGINYGVPALRDGKPSADGYGEPLRRDFFAQGDCDDCFLELMVQLGWFEDILEKIDLLPPKSAQRVRTVTDRLSRETLRNTE